MSMSLSVIIPTLNEAAALPGLLGDLQAQQGIALDLIVADGGSRDVTTALAEQHGARVVRTLRGRGRQMNAGAARGRGDWLLFIHADSRLPTPTLLRDALAALQACGPEAVAGHFPLRFEDYDPEAVNFYRYLEGKTRLNRPYTINGDQGLLLSRRFFASLGGFDESLPFLEDQRIAARIFAQGRWRLLPGELHTSARRFETEGRRARYTLMALMMGLHAAGVDEFFGRAPAVYAVQSETGRLDLTPMLALIRQLLFEKNGRRLPGILWRVGRFTRDNTWQLAYWRDQVHRAAALPRLRVYDRWLHPLMQNPLATLLATLLVSGWFFIVLPIQLQRRP